MNKNIFNVVKVPDIPRSVFDLSHDVKLSCNMGDLIPVYTEDCVPGDKFHINQHCIARFMPLVAPVMHRFDVTFHTWFVPKRLIWEGWNDYITDTKTAGLLPAPPYLTIGNGPEYTKLLDYMGIPSPVGGAVAERISAMPLAAYQCIYNEFYRDENLIPEVDFMCVDGTNDANTTVLGTLRKRAWEHDYFTSALPFVQKGDPVGLPVTGDALVKINAAPLVGEVYAEDSTPWQSTPSATPVTGPFMEREATTTPGIGANMAYADLEGAVVTTINDLRRANALQRWLEKLARGGSRLAEMIRGVFGVTPKDASLQRPQYIGGSKAPIIISDIEQTSQETVAGPSPQGNLAGKGTAVSEGSMSHYFCDEHGFIITLMSIMPKTAYQQGIEKFWLKTGSNTEHYFPDFANIGEQEILNRELFSYTAAGGDVFGYTPRYSEYKYRNSRVAGQFRTTLDFWHEGRIFASAPALNQAFIECIPDTRIFAVEDPAEDKLAVQVYNEVKAVRPMPKFGTPSF